METVLLVLACLFFPGITIGIITVMLLVLCWPVLPVLAILGSLLGMIGKSIKS